MGGVTLDIGFMLLVFAVGLGMFFTSLGAI
jgi:hypothetical protein